MVLFKKKRPVIILTTLPDTAAAEKLAGLLVEKRLAACVNILPPMQSVYFWEGKIARDQEVKLLVKTSSCRAAEAAEFIRQNHTYKVPEITTLGLKGDVTMQRDYWRWLSDYVR